MTIIVRIVVFMQNKIIIKNHFQVGYGDGMPPGVPAGKHILNLFLIMQESNLLTNKI
jgi:hypothetical protein